MLAAFALPLLLSMAPQDAPSLWFVFLMKGRPATAEERPRIQEMQKAHIANFNTQFAAKKLIAAGPLNDPTQQKRGIVVLTVKTREEAEACFKTDPYVQSGIMRVEAHPWTANARSINTEAKSDGGMEENRLLLLRRPSHRHGDAPAYLVNAHEKSLGKLRPTIYGRFTDTRQDERLHLYKGRDEARIRQALQADPLIRAGWLEYELLPLWMVKDALPAGTWKDRKE